MRRSRQPDIDEHQATYEMITAQGVASTENSALQRPKGAADRIVDATCTARQIPARLDRATRVTVCTPDTNRRNRESRAFVETRIMPAPLYTR